MVDIHVLVDFVSHMFHKYAISGSFRFGSNRFPNDLDKAHKNDRPNENKKVNARFGPNSLTDEFKHP